MTGPSAALIVIEFGASFPRWLDPSRAGTLAVVAQHYEGPPDTLITQVHSRVSRLLANGWSLKQAVLVCNGRMHLEQQAARSLLARQMLLCLRQCGGKSLSLTVARELEAKVLTALTALATGLDHYALPAGVELRVQRASGEAAYSRPAAALAATA